MTQRFKRPDHKSALSLIEAAEREMRFTLQLPITEESGSTIIKNIYDNFRKLGDAILVREGSEPRGHDPSIKRMLQLNVPTPRPIGLIETLRTTRSNVQYYGYIPTASDTEDAVDFAKKCFPALLQEVKKIIAGGKN
ncbi:hypothetical protein HZB02_03770 [Candidatus Woesearchaeota archaeon]|nr:hypothetical protein [Candidatus Woesearchaeota archaeon]